MTSSDFVCNSGSRDYILDGITASPPDGQEFEFAAHQVNARIRLLLSQLTIRNDTGTCSHWSFSEDEVAPVNHSVQIRAVLTLSSFDTQIYDELY